MQLLVYLPGGIQFNSGTLEKFSNNKIIYSFRATYFTFGVFF